MGAKGLRGVGLGMGFLVSGGVLATLADLVNDPENNEENGDWRKNTKEPNDKGEKPPIRESCEGVGILIRWRRVYGLHSYL